MGIKTAGGVRDLEGLKAMIVVGATGIGASAGGAAHKKTVADRLIRQSDL